MDVGILTLATPSYSTEIENPKTFNKYDSKLRKAQRDLSRKKKGSSNWNKQRSKVVRIHQKIRNVRTDCRHKASRILADTYNQIIFEDLQIKNMVKNHHLARSIHDASWGILLSLTTYKVEYPGETVELVNPRNTSKQRSVCGCIQLMSLSQRTYRCTGRGAVMGPDFNATINIKHRYVPADCGKFKPVEKGCMSNRYESGSPATCSGEEVTVTPVNTSPVT